MPAGDYRPMQNPFRGSVGYDVLADDVDVSQLKKSNADLLDQQEPKIQQQEVNYDDPQYVEKLLRQNSNCGQRFVIGLCSCGKIFHVSWALIAVLGFAVWVRESISQALDSNLQEMVQAIITALLCISCALV